MPGWKEFIDWMRLNLSELSPFSVANDPVIAFGLFVYKSRISEKMEKLIAKILSVFRIPEDKTTMAAGLLAKALVSKDPEPLSEIKACAPGAIHERIEKFFKDVMKILDYLKQHEAEVPDLIEDYGNEEGRFLIRSGVITWELLESMKAQLLSGPENVPDATGPKAGAAPTEELPANLSSYDEYREGVRLYRAGDLDGGVRMFRQSTKHDSKNIKAFKLLGLIQLSRGKTGEAKESFWSAVQCSPFDPEAYIGLGLTFLKEDDMEGCTRCFHKAAPQTIFNIRPWLNIGRFFLQCAQLDTACLCFKQAVAIRPDDSDAIDWFKSAANAIGDRELMHEALNYEKQAKAAPRDEDVPARVSLFGQEFDLARMHDDNLLDDDI